MEIRRRSDGRRFGSIDTILRWHLRLNNIYMQRALRDVRVAVSSIVLMSSLSQETQGQPDD